MATIPLSGREGRSISLFRRSTDSLGFNPFDQLRIVVKVTDKIDKGAPFEAHMDKRYFRGLFAAWKPVCDHGESNLNGLGPDLDANQLHERSAGLHVREKVPTVLNVGYSSSSMTDEHK